MWTRALLKKNARESLQRYYWYAFLVCLVMTLLAGSSGGFNIKIEIDADYLTQIIENVRWDLLWPYLTAAAVTNLVRIGFQIFVGNVLTVGAADFFLQSRELGRAASLDAMLAGFRNGYLKVVWTLLLREVYISLWSLLFLIPGIVKAYEYRMIPYLLADHPEITQEAAFAESRRLMTGHKWEAFVLDLSFLGWKILGALCCGLGGYFVTPYVEATYVEFYTALKQTV